MEEKKDVKIIQGRLGWKVGDITTVKPEQLTSHPKNKKIYGKDEKIPETFFESIKEKGVLEPLVIKKDKTIISGHRRWEAAKKANLEKIPARIADFDSKLEEREALIELNRQRDKTFSQKMREAEEVEEIYRKKHSDSQGERTDLKGNDEHSGNISTKLEKTRDDVAEEVGIGSGRQYDKAKKVWEKAEEGDEDAEKLVDNLDKGKETITSAHRKINRKEKKKEVEENVPEIPDEKYNLILADPPWKYDMPISDSRKIENQYPTMTIKEIKNIDVPTSDNCILFLWTTTVHLEKAFEVIDKWGFEYKTSMIWIKDSIGMGFYSRIRHEFVLIATKGDISPPEVENRFDSVIEAKRGKHSEKPKKLYERIEKMYPNKKYLEMFARNKRKKWDSWGVEIED